ncbi:manganese efflux pump MntP [Campylobacter volucris]|uniref:manganese efflux pump MntP n=1 Tax=Campylobacter volucris TaxID=1031542 RepID=UPI00189F51A7|nr:manganese efflux pump MntP family protein [Campylobacter volucris]MBF7044365.1 manganese efflux pump [Campylobacter volucris]
MDILSLIILSFALAADAFAVSLCKGFSVKELKLKHYLIVGLYFGGFQALMPAIGYILGSSFGSFVEKIDHWVAFVLLSIIGGKMIKESLEKDHCKENSNLFDFKTMIALGVATSIDALAVGVSFAFLKVNLLIALLSIGLITFIMCVLALKIGNKFGTYLKNKAEFIGGAILIFLAIKILLDHLYF